MIANGLHNPLKSSGQRLAVHPRVRGVLAVHGSAASLLAERLSEQLFTNGFLIAVHHPAKMYRSESGQPSTFTFYFCFSV